MSCTKFDIYICIFVPPNLAESERCIANLKGALRILYFKCTNGMLRAVGLYSKGMNCRTEILSYSILVLKDQYNLCISDVRTEYLPLKFPINNEDDVVEMYREYFKRKPQVKLVVIGKNISVGNKR